MCSVFWTCCKNLFFIMEFLKFNLILLFHLILRNYIVTHNVAEKYFISWHSWFDFIDLKKFIVDNINYLGWESKLFIRAPRVFKILSTKFQWTQTIGRDLVERSAYSMILGDNTKFLVNYLHVAGSNLAH